MKKIIFLFLLLILSAFVFFKKTDTNIDYISYTVDLQKQEVKMYWKDEQKNIFKSIQNLKNWLLLKDIELVFAMNGGMYTKTNTPQGLYIESSKRLIPIDTTSGKGNFYLKPNGIFYITQNKTGHVCKTTEFDSLSNPLYATQSGPLLLINNKIHPAFKKGSKNLNIRNGVGILKNGKVHFAMSKKEVNFYDFALYFKNLGCENALYLDGFVSRTYLPEKNWNQTDGNFGVIIGVTKQ